MTEFSTVVPVYRCAGCLEELCRRLVAAFEGMGKSFEIVLVDDCAKDGSWEVIERISARDKRVRGVLLSRNYGQHIAITAGLRASCGQSVIVMDCDLQDPPEEIPRLYQKAQEGYDIVYTRRLRKRTGVFRVWAARVYWWLYRRLSGSDFDPAVGPLSLISRQVVEAFLQFQDRDRHYLHILMWLGFHSAHIDYDHQDRHSGRSSYTLLKLIRLAVDGMIFQTTNLLRWIVYAGFGMAAAGAALASYLVFLKLTHASFPGWTSLMVVLLVCSGMTTTSIGVCGLYLGKVFEQVKGRPLFVVRRMTQAPNEGQPRAEPSSASELPS